MISNFLVTGTQVLILFILIAVGFACGKFKLFDDRGANTLMNLVLYVVTPCTIINAFQREFKTELLIGILIAFGAAFAIHIINIAVSFLIKSKSDDTTRVMRFAAIFSNCGYMSIPLQESLLGSIGVFYGAPYIAVFNLLTWSYGQVLLAKKGSKISWLKIFVNPGVIGVTVGLVLFVTAVPLPEVILKPISSLAALNTPLPMIIIGYQLSKINLLTVWKDVRMYGIIALRLIALPIVALGLMYLVGIRDELLITLTIAASAPAAAVTSIFAAKHERDVDMGVKLVTVSTLFSIITMPVIVGIAQFLA